MRHAGAPSINLLSPAELPYIPFDVLTTVLFQVIERVHGNGFVNHAFLFEAIGRTQKNGFVDRGTVVIVVR